MKNEEKIIRLLTNEDISSEELEELEQIASQDPYVNKLVYINSSISKVVSKVHPDIDLIAEYVLFKNNKIDKVLDFEKLQLKLQQHFSTCADCRNLYQDLSNEYQEIDTHIVEYLKNNSTDLIEKNKPILSRIYYSAYAFSAAAVIVLVMFLSDYLTKSPLVDFTETIIIENNYQTRNVNAADYMKVISAIRNENIETAIHHLENYIANSTKDESRFYDHFILGKLYLSSAQSSLLGLFESYDEEKILISINNFNKSISLNQNGRFPNVNSDSKFYIGLAFALINKKNEAIKKLSQVIEEGGQFSVKAKELMLLLEK